MSKRVIINNQKQIPVILDLIHDCWFDASEITHDHKTAILSIRFKREMVDRSRVLKRNFLLKKKEVPVIECFLNIHHVKSYRIRDTERVGFYDFNELEYDPNLKRIHITTGVPIDIQVTVNRFEIEVEESDKIIEFKTKTSIFS